MCNTIIRDCSTRGWDSLGCYCIGTSDVSTTASISWQYGTHTTDSLWANCGRTFVVFMTGRFQMSPACAHGQVVCLWITQGDRHHGIKPIPHVTVHLSTHLYATTTRGISSIDESMVSGDSCPAGQVRVAIVCNSGDWSPKYCYLRRYCEEQATATRQSLLAFSSTGVY